MLQTNAINIPLPQLDNGVMKNDQGIHGLIKFTEVKLLSTGAFGYESSIGFNCILFQISFRALQKMTGVTQNKISFDWGFLCSFSTVVLRQECINKWLIYIVIEMNNIIFSKYLLLSE